MRTTDWKFDFSSLPRWSIRDSIYVYDEFFEIPQSDALCCIYSVAEVRMLDYRGFLAIIKTKQAPELFLNVTEDINFTDNFFVNKKGNLIFLRAHMYNTATETLKCPVLIIDIVNNVFSYIDTKNVNPSYKVVELSDDVFGIEASERDRKGNKHLDALCKKKIRIKRLKWYELTEINSLPNLIFRKTVTRTFLHR